MKARILIDGTQQLRERMIGLAEAAKTDRFVRKGMSNAARIVARAQKNMAPVRKGRVQVRKLNKLLQKGVSSSKALQRSSVAVAKFRAIPVDKKTGTRSIGPRRFIPPGLLKRSIGFRVKKERGTGEYSVVIGANVGKKRRNPNNAPHAAFVGSGTKPRKGRGTMPGNPYISVATNFAAPAAMKALEAGVHAEIAAAAVR